MADFKERSAEEYFNGEWVHEAGILESMMKTSCKLGNYLLSSYLRLKSAEPLQEEDVRRAVVHIYRKAPNLSLCYGYRNGSLWMRRATNSQVDFKVLRGLRIEEVKDSLINYRYNDETGPLFCVRLLQDSPDTIKDEDNLEPSFPHQSYLFIGMHHGITDGISYTLVMGSLISLLNAIISGQPIDDEPLGILFPSEQTLNFIMEKKAMLEADPDFLSKLGKEIRFRSDQRPLLIYNFYDPGDLSPGTVQEILNQKTTSRFITKCRQEKVSVNSAITALANRSVVDLLVENEVIQDSYSIKNSHMVNCRRYWEVKDPKALGCHITAPLKAFMDTPKDLNGNFWDYARSLHNSLKSQIESGRCMLDMAYGMMTRPEDFDLEEYFLSPLKNYHSDFVTSNMGDVTSNLTEGGEHVKITHFVMSSAIHLTENALLFNIHTFRGKMHFSLDYVKGAVSGDAIKRFLSQFVMLLKKSCN